MGFRVLSTLSILLGWVVRDFLVEVGNAACGRTVHARRAVWSSTATEAMVVALLVAPLALLPPSSRLKFRYSQDRSAAAKTEANK